MAEREGEIVAKGNDESVKLVMDVYNEFELPLGLLPLDEVIDLGFTRSNGYVRIILKEKVEHTFKMINKVVSYDAEITGYVEKRRMKKLKGVKSKELMFWASISEIIVDDPPSGKINFKGYAGITKTFPIEAFAAGQ